MWRFKEKRKLKNTSSKNAITIIEECLKNRFVSVMQAVEKRLTSRQRIFYFCLYFFIMVVLCTSTLLNSYIFKTRNKTPPHNNIVILPDISLPDSLDINYLKNLRNIHLLKDSNSTYLKNK